MQAVIVFAHGSRDPLWRLPVEAVAQTIAQRSTAVTARCAYLELCEPSLPTAAAELVAAGAHEVRVLPLFFGMGKHAREDLPQLMLELQQRHPEVNFRLLPTAGENPKLLHVLADMALEAPNP
ncbi:MAG: CbiX/SirB N-terminal domain-containing protein [Burkholderiaceae bacterium]|nr:CbiX/SirB N-terminal domain-containing protein [Burkholderiaceae bacterium]